jgi:hypothetical protein
LDQEKSGNHGANLTDDVVYKWGCNGLKVILLDFTILFMYNLLVFPVVGIELFRKCGLVQGDAGIESEHSFLRDPGLGENSFASSVV